MKVNVQNYGYAEACPSHSDKRGYTIVELMVTILIVSVLAVTVGMFFVKLLSIKEREREEAYIREKLADICGAYADVLSVGSSICMSNQTILVNYRHETGGVSLETGLVTHVAQLVSLMNTTNNTLDLNIYAFMQGELGLKVSRKANGDAPLIPLPGDMMSCTIVPLNGNIWEVDGVQISDAALGYLEVKARYAIKNSYGEIVTNIVRAGRVVRLWNRE